MWSIDGRAAASLVTVSLPNMRLTFVLNFMITFMSENKKGFLLTTLHKQAENNEIAHFSEVPV